MYSTKLAEEFSKSVGEESGLSTGKVERLLKDLGFRTVRKTVSLLNKNGVIEPASVISDSTDIHGRRVSYGFESTKDAVAYLLAEEVAGLKGKQAEDKYRYFSYAKAAVQDVLNIECGVSTAANITSLTSAQYFIHKDIYALSERLIRCKDIQRVLFIVLMAYWFTSRWVKREDDLYDIVTDWLQVRDLLFNKRALRRFYDRFKNAVQNDNSVCGITLSEVNEVVEKLGNNTKGIESMIAWIEIMMTFNKGTIFVSSEAEAYFKQKYGLQIDLQQDNELLITALYKALK